MAAKRSLCVVIGGDDRRDLFTLVAKTTNATPVEPLVSRNGKSLTCANRAGVPRLLEQVATTFRRKFIHRKASLKFSSPAANSLLRGIGLARHRHFQR
jgi:hypothetical protein